ncbi:MAG: type III-B CRISPR module RAMP protein Cmr6 [Anaerolineae bacterium]
MEYPIPKDSAEAWRKHKGKSPQNPGLIFDRFVQNWGASRDDKEAKKRAWEEIVATAKKADPQLLKAWNARWEQTVRQAQATPFALRTDWRFVAGMGRKGPLEVGFTFHRYGFPILPGSSVKGIARAWATLVEKLNEKDAPDFVTIFGRAPEKGEDPQVAQAGQAVFFDAIPATLPTLKLDIMNPHFPDYYQDEKGRTPPTDWQSPVPIYFLTVAPNTEFRFAVGWRGPLDAERSRLRGLAERWLWNGLTHLGAGAKTSAGYGFFCPTEAE